MTCALVLVGSFWINTCQVLYLRDYPSDRFGADPEMQCVIAFTGHSREVEIPCETVAALLNNG